MSATTAKEKKANPMRRTPPLRQPLERTAVAQRPREHHRRMHRIGHRLRHAEDAVQHRLVPLKLIIENECHAEETERPQKLSESPVAAPDDSGGDQAHRRGARQGRRAEHRDRPEVKRSVHGRCRVTGEGLCRDASPGLGKATPPMMTPATIITSASNRAL